MNLTDKFLQLALLGANWVLWILVVLSVASVALVIERWLYFRSLTGRDATLLEPIHRALSTGKRAEAAKLVADSDAPGARLVKSMLDAVDSRGAAALMNGKRMGERLRLERNLSFLGTVGANAPFIGLFGTVLEILRVFNLLGAQGVTSGEEAAKIMTGISEALVATAIGLLVAIPAVIAYNTFQRRVKHLLGEADALTGVALSLIESAPKEPS